MARSTSSGAQIPQENGTIPKDKLEPIAIIGMSAKFPQDATTPASFWKMICEGRSARVRDSQRSLERRRLLSSRSHSLGRCRFTQFADAFPKILFSNYRKANHRGGHFLNEPLGAFDAPFFSISRIEAESLDPQQRDLLKAPITPWRMVILSPRY